ncbi:MAG: hypothetical protein IBJ11_08385 [Phycisphaerales bacterium]|nr:hypothetical protein [Phycisphaerales bacterium]
MKKFSALSAIGVSGTVVLSLASGAGVHAEPYRVTDLGSLPGFERSMALKITDRGDVVGVAQNAGGPRRLFSWQPVADQYYPMGWTDRGPAPNNFGRNKQDGWASNMFFSSAGMSQNNAAPLNQAMLVREKDGYSEVVGLGTLPGGVLSCGLDINSGEMVVGWSGVGGGTFHGFYWTPSGGLTDLPPLAGQAHARALGVNDRLQVVGSSLSSAFADDQARWNPLHIPIARDDDERAVIWKRSGPIDLNTLVPPGSGWRLQVATDINNLGQIVGLGVNPAGELRAFRLELALGDYNGDGVEDSRDLADFVRDFSFGSPRADVTDDGELTELDVVAFVCGWLRPPVLTTPQVIWSSSGSQLGMVYEMIRPLDLSPGAIDEGTVEIVNQVPAPPTEEHEFQEWKEKPGWPNVYDKKYNPRCYGCPGGAPGNDNPDGKDGWPGGPDHIRDVRRFITDPSDWPYYVDGGPGGRGKDGGRDGVPPAGRGGNGGKGHDTGNGGAGGAGGNGRGTGSGGRGGDGGDGGGRGGKGGSGGNGGSGEPSSRGGNGLGGDGGKGGRSGGGGGGDGGKGGDGFGSQPGGNGGDGGTGNGNRRSGKGGDGGKGGDRGGPGGQGGKGGDADDDNQDGGDGGRGGDGGQNSKGGDGGPGGNGNSRGVGGNGGEGGKGGQGKNDDPFKRDGGSGGNGGKGGDGGVSGGRPGGGGKGGDGGKGANPDGRGGPGGTGGPGGNGSNNVPKGPAGPNGVPGPSAG